MWITAGLAILKNLTGLAKDLNSGENREKKFHVAMNKNAKEATNIAEDYMEEVNENMKFLPPKVQKKLKKLERKFDKMD